MKVIQKITSMLALCLVLGFGITQLTTKAYAGSRSCPANHCDDLDCITFMNPIKTCEKNMQTHYIHIVNYCGQVRYCYFSVNYGIP